MSDNKDYNRGLLSLSDNQYGSGGGIHIKPENRGKFTALLKRTGKSASWFKEHGTPLQKKRATFALNARKWKHGDGGLLDRFGADAVREALSRMKGREYQTGGDKKETKKIKLLGKYAEKLTNGLIKKEDVPTILNNPSDWMTKLYGKQQLDTMRRRLYKEFYPAGYNLNYVPVASDIMQGKETTEKDNIWLRNFMQRNIANNGAPSEQLRDSYFSHYLGIPVNERRYDVIEPSPFRPTVGDDEDMQILRPKKNSVRDYEKQIVDFYNSAVRLSGNRNFNDGDYRPVKVGDNAYMVLPVLGMYANHNLSPRSKREDRKFVQANLNDFNDIDLPNSVGNGLNLFTVSSGVDPERGQYISLFDKWDLNPLTGNKYAEKTFRKIAKLSGLNRDIDVTGGLGKPFWIYDRVYLDDYYGVSSKPDDGEYYGGYIVPSVVSAENKQDIK